MIRRGLARRAGRAALFSTLIAGAVFSPEAQGNPQVGEARSLNHDADRVYTVVAGEADGSATVQNPANLGYLRGLSGVIDFALTKRSSERRGSGVGAFLGIPVRDWVAFGLGYQVLMPHVTRTGDTDSMDDADNRFGKLSLALSVPLMRWARGLSAGLAYSRMFSGQNFWAADVNQLDIGLSWWANRTVALGVNFRGLTQPRVGPSQLDLPLGSADCVDGAIDDATTTCVTRLGLTIDPELAFRPSGTDVFEIGIGARINPFKPDQFRVAEATIQPRARALFNFGGVRLFGEAEAYALNVDIGNTLPQPYALRVHAGLGVDFGNVGLASGLSMGAGASSPGVQGGVGRLRISQERYRTAANVAPRTVVRLQMAKYRGDRGMFRLTRQIEKLGRRGAQTLLIETAGLGLSYAQVEEVREAILRFRARGGKVAIYLDGANLRSYFLASATDRIISHPHTALSVLGLYTRTLYYGDLIERLGAKAEFVRIADYKGTPEVYSQKTASEPVRRQRKQLQADGWNHVLRLVARERGRDVSVIDEWIDSGPHRPKAALELGMVDHLAWPDELDEELEDWLGKKVRIESPPRLIKHRSDYGPQPRVAVLYISGELVTGPSVNIPLLGRRLVGSDTIVAQIKKLRADDNVRAVVVRISSPGGSVAAADRIARQLDLTAEKKPIVISFGAVAASGGYYIATAGDYIVSDATTITGSIGIFYPKVDLSGFLEKFGVGIDVTSHGDHAGLRSWFKPYSPSELAAAERGIAESYDIFINRVAEARAMTPEQARAVAGGRLWSGVRAMEVGLVDRYGGMREAIMRARRMAGMRPDEGEVVGVPRPATPLQNLLTLFGLNIGLPIGKEQESGERLSLRPRLFEPILDVLGQLPGALWVAGGPEPLAMDTQRVTLE